MSQIELEKIVDHFDRDQDGYIDLSEISSIHRGIRRARSIAKKPVSGSEKIDHEVRMENTCIILNNIFERTNDIYCAQRNLLLCSFQ